MLRDEENGECAELKVLEGAGTDTTLQKMEEEKRREKNDISRNDENDNQRLR